MEKEDEWSHNLVAILANKRINDQQNSRNRKSLNWRPGTIATIWRCAPAVAILNKPFGISIAQILLLAWVPMTAGSGSLYGRAWRRSRHVGFAFLDPASFLCGVSATNTSVVCSWLQPMPTTSCASDHSSRVSILYTFLEWGQLVGGPGSFLVALQHQGYTMVWVFTQNPKAQWNHAVLPQHRRVATFSRWSCYCTEGRCQHPLLKPAWWTAWVLPA